MRELSLFTGAGCGLLGTHCLLGWESKGYIEINEHCRKAIRQRIDEGIINNAPIYGDIREFIDQGYARVYQGMVDVITAGFPCQPFSTAGKRKGESDERNMWPYAIETIRLVRPRFVLLENVPNLKSKEKAKVSIQWIEHTLFGRERKRIETVLGLPSYFGRVLRDLSQCGYDARWRILSASDLGAPHKRDRLWIVAYSDGVSGKAGDERARWAEGTNANRRSERTEMDTLTESQHSKNDSHSESERRAKTGSSVERSKKWFTGIRSSDCDSEREGLAQREMQSENKEQKQPAIIRTDWWSSEPRLGRLADGVPRRVERLRAAGNGQVPCVVASAWNLLTDGLFE